MIIWVLLIIILLSLLLRFPFLEMYTVEQCMRLYYHQYILTNNLFLFLFSFFVDIKVPLYP